MGGGGDSRIPSILNEHVPENVSVIVRTYSFDPEIAWGQISSWLEELQPALVIGESLGALNAIRISGVPHLLVSPSLNAPLYVGYLAFLALLPGVTPILDRVYRPKDGDRQKLHFTFRTMRKYRALMETLLRTKGFVHRIRRNAFHGGGVCHLHARAENYFSVFCMQSAKRRPGVVFVFFI